MLKLGVLFAAMWVADRTPAMDGAPRTSSSDLAPSGSASARSPAEQNGYAVDGASNFLAVYRDLQLKAAFFLFLQNVYHIYPEDKFHRLIEEACTAGASDRDIYGYAQSRLGEIRPFLADFRYALPALAKQKAEMSRQTFELLGDKRVLNGYLEIGTTGRYIGHLKSELQLRGDVVLLHTDAPSYSPTDIVERGRVSKIGRFVALDDYAPIAPAQVADGSMDLVTNFIGFHHAPPARRDGFVKSVYRVLRPGGRLILRDHDVSTVSMNRLVALAHDVFNMGLGAHWRVNQEEIRNFTSMTEMVRYLEDFGFKAGARVIAQSGDPTRNILMMFTKV